MSVWLFRSCLSPASRFRSSRTEAAHSFRSVSRSVSFNRSPCVASLRDPNPYTFERTATNGSSTRIPSTKESRRQVGAGVAERGTRRGAAGANRLGASSCRGHARYHRARAESIGAVAQWERITLAVWGSRVRIPPAPRGEAADTMPSIGVVPRKVFRPQGQAPLSAQARDGRLFVFLKGGRDDERSGKEDRSLHAHCHRREVARALGLVRPPQHARRLR